MKKIVALLLVCVIAVSLFAGCGDTSESSGGTGTQDGSSTENSIRIGITADPGTMSPYIFGGHDYSKVAKSIYQTMAFRKEDKTLEPIIAESWEQIDPLTYTVKIKENVHDSENNPITASDVVFSCQQHYDSGMSTTWKYSDDEKPFEKTGDYEVTFYFAQETCSAFESILAGVSIVSEAAFTASPDEFVNTPVGTGPYKLENWVVGSEVTLVKNENYWDDNPYKFFEQNMDSIVFKVISEPAQRAIELEIGGVDLIYNAQASDLNRFEENPDFVTNKVDDSQVLNMYFNCSEYSVCRDIRLRHAVAYAIDTNAIALTACEGLAIPSPSVAYKTSVEYRDEFDGRVLYEQNIETAKALIDEMKAEGIDPSFTILTDENKVKVSAATIIQEAMKTIGVDVTVQQLESAVFQATYGDMEAWDAYMGLGGSNSPYTMEKLGMMLDRTQIDDQELIDAVDLAFKKYIPENSDRAIDLFDEAIPVLTINSVLYAYAYRAGLQGADEFVNSMIYPGYCRWE